MPTLWKHSSGGEAQVGLETEEVDRAGQLGGGGGRDHGLGGVGLRQGPQADEQVREGRSISRLY